MKKGFTMIELMAIFTLLGIILIISVPQITSLIKKNKASSYEEFEQTVFLATESYIVDKKININRGFSVTIDIKDVITSNYLKSTLVNPKTNKKVSESNIRIIASKDSEGILTYRLIET